MAADETRVTDAGAAGATPPEQRPPDQQGATAGDGSAASSSADTAASSIPTIDGVPLFVIGTPFNDHGVGILAGYDPEASHEQGQPAIVPETDQAPAHEFARSGGSAYYVDLVSGKGWSVALGKDG